MPSYGALKKIKPVYQFRAYALTQCRPLFLIQTEFESWDPTSHSELVRPEQKGPDQFHQPLAEDQT